MSFLQEFDLVAVNTTFTKIPENLITYREDKQHQRGEPFTGPTYEVIDYVLVQQVETAHNFKYTYIYIYMKTLTRIYAQIITR